MSETKLNQLAYEKILKAIVYGRLDLGEPLSENDLSKAMNVSKAPVRQSLNELKHNARALLRSLKKIVVEMNKADHSADLFQSKLLDTEFHQTFLEYSQNRYLIQSYKNIDHSAEALRYRFMDTAVYRNRAFDEHQKILELLTAGNVSKACDVLGDHISRTKHFHARVNWSLGRSQRKDYKFRDYAAIFAD